MSRSVAFLRSINVGGRRVTKDELIAAFTDQGYHDVDTFLASGNVMFGAGPEQSDEALSDAVGRHLGYDVPTTVRTEAQLEDLQAAEPFPATTIESVAGKPQVILLFQELTRSAATAVAERSSAHDLLVAGPRAVYWLPTAGISGSELTSPRLQKLVGQNTVRTMNTIERLLSKL